MGAFVKAAVSMQVPGDDAATVAVEEIFLEGEGAVVLHHAAGSDQASDLLESSGVWKIQLPEFD